MKKKSKNIVLFTLLSNGTKSTIIIDPRHEISNKLVCTTSKGSDQPVHTRSLIRAYARRSLEYFRSFKLLTEHHLEFLSLKGGCTDSSESTLVKMQHCWKSHVAAHILSAANILLAEPRHRVHPCSDPEGGDGEITNV